MATSQQDLIGMQAQDSSSQNHSSLSSSEPVLFTAEKQQQLLVELNKGNLELCTTMLSTITKLKIQTALTPKQQNTLFKALALNTTITSLELQQNEIEAEGAIGLAQALRTNRTLTSLIFGENPIGVEGIEALAQALTVNTRLRSLMLTSIYIGNDDWVKYIAQALIVNTRLTSFDLWFNDIGDNGAKSLAQVLAVNTTLTSLGLGFNRIKADGAKALAQALRTNVSLTSLNLSNNLIDDDGAKALEHARAENIWLTSLNLENNHIGDDSNKKADLKHQKKKTTDGSAKSSFASSPFGFTPAPKPHSSASNEPPSSRLEEGDNNHSSVQSECSIQ